MIINNLEELPKVIYKLRIEKKMTQKMLADKSGITQQTISSFEKGNVNVSLHTLVRILHALDQKLILNRRE